MENALTKDNLPAEVGKPKAENRVIAAVVIAILSLLCAAVILLTRPPAKEENTLFRQGLLAVVISGRRGGWGYINYLALYRALGQELKRAEREQRKKKG